MTTEKQQKQQEAAAVEAMHAQQWATPVAGVDDEDDEFSPWGAPTPTADELARLRARVAELEAQLQGWNTIPAERLIAFWNGDDCDDAYDDVGEWIEELRHGVNVGRYYSGLEPL